MNGKKLGNYMLIGLLSILVGLMFMGCSDEERDDSCSDCHDDSTTIVSMQTQWAASVHATGGNFERNGSGCAGCHASEGFSELMTVGNEEPPDVAAAISNPSPINCRTCHEIHTNYDESDFALVGTDPGEIRVTGETVDFGKGNLCINCHQSRVGSPLAVPGGGDIEITSFRWGPHHGPQGNVFAGIGGIELPGSASYASSLHTSMITDGCVSCHMAEAYGAQAGGHTMKMGYDYHDALRPNLAGCEDCHEDIEDFDLGGLQTEIIALLEELHGLMEADGLLREDGYILPAVWSSDKAGAYYNYKLIEEDRSNGVHNPKYAKALLVNSIAVFK